MPIPTDFKDYTINKIGAKRVRDATMISQTITIRQLFEAYIYYRQQHAPPDTALKALRGLRPAITSDERNALVDYIRRWESGEGNQYPPRANVRLQLWTPSATAPDRPTRPAPQQMPSRPKKGTRQFSPQQIGQMTQRELEFIAFIVEGFENKPLLIDINKQPEIVIGRASLNSVLLPDIDLTPYGAEALGVSRVHARLKYKNGVVTLADMGSVNFTYLNDERLHPEEVRVVRNNSEIRLGKLQMRVVFRWTTN